jgi:hypothetical protein
MTMFINVALLSVCNNHTNLLDPVLLLPLLRDPRQLCADSAGYCNTDSLSVSHWRGGTRALDPVIESESIPPSDLVGAKIRNADTDKSPPTSPLRIEEGMTVQLYPSFDPNSKQESSDSPKRTSATGSVGIPSARVTSTSDSTSGSGSAPGGISTRVSAGNKAATQHARNVSTVSSTGASPEYEEEDLDDDWRTLLEEVNALLASKNYTPIRNAR